jgi:L-cysteine:1D-myo-inositol 2-amino-2-deoxy-alpha-D-glucopyranoside ligase
VIAARYLGVPFDVQGGGTDLLFPHHEMSVSHLRGMTANPAPVAVHAHTGLIGLNGEKMSKSRGNLVLVSKLVAQGVDPAAIRLALLADHYRRDRDWTAELLRTARRRLAAWRAVLVDGETDRSAGSTGAPDASRVDEAHAADPTTDSSQLKTLARLRRALALDLDTPAAIAAVDHYVAAHRPGDPAPALVRDAVEALLGIGLNGEHSPHS